MATEQQQPIEPKQPEAPLLTLDRSKVWDRAIENFVLKTAIGAAAGVGVGALLFRAPTARAIAFGTCMGTGFGFALHQNQLAIEKNRQ